MNLIEYQPLARRTMKELPTLGEHLEHMMLGVIGELGEFFDAIKKFAVYGKPQDRVNLHEEGGDALWYIVGYLPELDVPVGVLQAGFDQGYTSGKLWNLGRASLLASVIATSAKACYDIGETTTSANTRFAAISLLGRSMGLLYGFFDLSLEESLDRNIAKLQKRYGEKYSDLAALNRDLDGERAVLEGGSISVAKYAETTITPLPNAKGEAKVVPLPAAKGDGGTKLL